MSSSGQVYWWDDVCNSDGSYSHSICPPFEVSARWFRSLVTSDGESNTYQFYERRLPVDGADRRTQLVSFSASGDERWALTISADSQPCSNIAIDALGVIYVITADGYLYAIDESSKAALSPPANVAASDGSFIDHVKVTWDALDEADGYIVFRKDGREPLGYTTDTEWLDYTVTNHAPYEYGVVSANALRDSAVSRWDAGNLRTNAGQVLPTVPLDWSMPNHDAGRTRHSTVNGPLSAALAAELVLEITGPSSRYQDTISEVVSGGYGNGYFTAPYLFGALDASGSLAWKIELPFDNPSAPAVDQRGNIYYIGNSRHSNDGSMLCSASPDRDIRWMRDLAGLGALQAITQTGLIMVYADSILSVYSADGDIAWSKDHVRASAIGPDGTTYGIVSEPGITAISGIIALDSGGNEIWRREADVSSMLYVGPDNTVYCYDMEKYLIGHLRAFDSAGNLQWEYTSDGILSEPAIADNGILYFQHYAYEPYSQRTLELICFDATTQDIVWRQALESNPQEVFEQGLRLVAPLVDGAGNIYTTAVFCQIVSSFTADGDLLWSYHVDPIEGTYAKQMSLSPAGKLYVSNSRHQLFIIE
jgi:outer membrane protein assembly factor BamB